MSCCVMLALLIFRLGNSRFTRFIAKLVYPSYEMKYRKVGHFRLMKVYGFERLDNKSKHGE